MAYSYKRSITIDKTQVPSTQTNFPVLVSISDPTFRTAANGGHVQSPFAADINFYADSAGTTLLTWGNEYYEPTTGVYVTWVKIPSVSSVVDTVFYVFYGDSTIVVPPTTDPLVWDTNYKAVYHLLTYLGILITFDSTSNVNNASSTNVSPVPAKIDGGASIGSSSLGWIDGGTSSTLDPVSAFTTEAWVKPSSAAWPGVDGAIFGKFNPVGFAGYFLFLDSSGNVFFVLNGFSIFSFVFAISLDVFTHIVLSWDGSTYYFYKNGVQVATISSSTAPTSAGGNFLIGKYADVRYINAVVDEVRYSSIRRLPDWITTEYNNQNSPSTFLTLGSEITLSTGFNNQRLLLGV